MNIIRNMSQERMEWLQKLGYQVVGDIRTTGVDEVYRQLIAAGHPEDLHFLYALRGAVEDLDTVAIMKNIEEWENAKGK